MTDRHSRRDFLARSSAAGTAAAAVLGAGAVLTRTEEPVNAQSNQPAPRARQSNRPASEPFGYCFNTSTIRGQKLPLTKVIDVTAKAGWGGIEPWMDEITTHVEAGGTTADLRKRIADAGLAVPSAIGFAEWIIDDPARRKAGLEHARRDMDLVAQIGGTRIAAPPIGAHETGGVDLFAAAERYHALCEVGRQAGVVPQVEVWGFSKQLKRLGEAVFVAVESGHPDACVLADPYHIYKGGSSLEGIKLMSAACLQHLHVNDYPADPPRETIGDEHRVYPGDGVAPLDALFRTLRDVGFTGMLSLELFSKALYQQDPLEVAKTGLEKTRAAVKKALG
jgi:2-keto-myo-inositol isomerase